MNFSQLLIQIEINQSKSLFLNDFFQIVTFNEIVFRTGGTNGVDKCSIYIQFNI